MLNKCCFIGRIGADPEKKSTPSGAEVTNFSIAVSEKFKDKSGNNQELTEWIRCNAWNKLASIIAQFGRKGMQVYVEGKWKTRDYEKNGVKHYVTELVVNQFIMLDSKQKEDGYQQSPPQQRREPMHNTPPDSQGGGFMEDDVPF